MNCRKICLYLADYLNSDLDQATSAQVREHLKKCAVCQEQVKFLGDYQKSISSMVKQEAPSDFVVKFHQNLRDSKNLQKPSSKPWFIYLLERPALAGLVTIALIWIVFNPFKFINKLERLDEKPLVSDSAPKLNKEQKKEVCERALPDETLKDNFQSKEARAPVGAEIEGANKAEFNLSVSIAKRIPAPVMDLSENSFAEKSTSVMRTKISESELDKPDLLSIAKNTVESVNGEIIFQEEKSDQNQLTVIVSLPASKYRDFLKRLEEIGTVEGGVEDFSQKSFDSIIRIKLRFIGE